VGGYTGVQRGCESKFEKKKAPSSSRDSNILVLWEWGVAAAQKKGQGSCSCQKGGGCKAAASAVAVCAFFETIWSEYVGYGPGTRKSGLTRPVGGRKTYLGPSAVVSGKLGLAVYTSDSWGNLGILTLDSPLHRRLEHALPGLHANYLLCADEERGQDE
jgi:hypothetical protein